MPSLPSHRAWRSIASRRKKCAGAAAVIAAGVAGTGVTVAGVGAAAVGVAGTGAGIAAVAGAAAIGVVVVTGKPGISWKIKKAPRKRGFCHAFETVSKRGNGHSATRCHKGSRDR